jgi:hypothetical protein
MAGAEIRIPADEQLNPPLLSDFHIPDGARMLRLLPLRGEEGGGLVEDSSLQCPRWRKVVRRRAAIGGLRICLAMEGDGLIGSSASCDHEVGKEAGVEDSGQQI